MRQCCLKGAKVLTSQKVVIRRRGLGNRAAFLRLVVVVVRFYRKAIGRSKRGRENVKCTQGFFGEWKNGQASPVKRYDDIVGIMRILYAIDGNGRRVAMARPGQARPAASNEFEYDDLCRVFV